MKKSLTLSAAQAGALLRLIQMQVEAYEEAVHCEEDCAEPRDREKTAEPFTVSDLELLEPLLAKLRKG